MHNSAETWPRRGRNSTTTLSRLLTVHDSNVIEVQVGDNDNGREGFAEMSPEAFGLGFEPGFILVSKRPAREDADFA
jgi:hypothetical protein